MYHCNSGIAIFYVGSLLNYAYSAIYKYRVFLYRKKCHVYLLYCTAVYVECTKHLSCLLVIVLQYLNVQNIYYACLLLYCSTWINRIYIMLTCYCTAVNECTEYILCLLVIVLQYMNVQNIYYCTCYCTAGY